MARVSTQATHEQDEQDAAQDAAQGTAQGTAQEQPVSTQDSAAPDTDTDAAYGDEAESESEPEPGRVTLSDGRVAVVRRVTGLDEEGVETTLAKWGYGLDNLDYIAFGRAQAVFGLDTLDGEPFETPAEQVALDAFLMRHKVRDLISLQLAYDALNGTRAPEPAVPAGHTLTPHEIVLSTGTIVRVREETGRDEQRRNRVLADLGYTTNGLAQISYGRAAALMAIDAIDGQLRRPPQTRAQLQALLRWWASDILRVINLSGKVNGAGGGATFRG